MDHNNTGQKNMIKQTLWKPGGTILEKDLKMEVFASVDTVKPVEFHVYELHVQKIGNTYSIIRGAAWKLRNWNQAGVFEDGNKDRKSVV